jgi:dimethylaniline monooxygenase (N-oxide forming)
LIFRFIAKDFIKSLHQQDLPQTIPHHPFTEALSGAIHLEPEGYLEGVRDGRIRIVRGIPENLRGREVRVRVDGGDGVERIQADYVVLATGYKVVRLLPPCTPTLKTAITS